mmetsp:Transcript_7966/g.29120  ORF Transcript_7966/g.29120 Transcript_7966/m.29120 type:complete len:741 (-) Transcript_7966:407-2629(-)
MQTSDESRIYLKKRFADFLEKSQEGNHHKLIEDLVLRRERRLSINLNALRQFDASLANSLLREPGEYLSSLTEAVGDVVSTIDPKYLSEGDIRITFTGGFGFHRISPRELLSPFLGKIVNVEGIVTKCSCVRPKVVKTTHFCEATGRFVNREYRDVTSSKGTPTSTVYPTRDENGNLLTTEYGLCSYRDYQSINVQEMPESAPPGQLPCSIDVVLEDDLVDLCKPGDRVSVVGIYKAIPMRTSGSGLSGVFRTVLVALGIFQLSKEVVAPSLSHEDIKNINELPRKFKPRALLELLGRSFAPSICGHDHIKRALVLLLLGGSEKNLNNGTHIRGDINCLMVGDPSVAKSQLLRCVLGVAAYAVSTTGRGSSGVGLTAAVTTDQETGERRLEAGAMVLADRGVVCIDEFDKMNDADRVAIHEVMEQQTVTIAKAGIHASLNARCSVVAAANPIYGNYDHSQGVTRNINLPDSLLSRFDLLFIVLDQSDTKVDRDISAHVLGMHSMETLAASTTNILHGDSALMHNNVEPEMYSSHKPGSTVLSKRFLQKFIYYAKHRPWDPILSKESETFIAEQYAQWRVDKASDPRNRRTLPITARTLETMIRLSVAHAKMRLSKSVDVEDAAVAIEIMRFIVESEGLAASNNKNMDKDSAPCADMNKNQNEIALMVSLNEVDHSKISLFQKRLHDLMFHRDFISLEELNFATTAWVEEHIFTEEDVKRIVEELKATNKLMINEGLVHLI